MPSLDNAFVTQFFDWDNPGSWKTRLVNSFLAKLGSSSRLVNNCRTGVMTNVEQRINMFHLIGQVLAYGVEGDLVELGTYRGSSSALIQKVIDLHGADRQLHVYDTFSEVPAEEVYKTFAGLGLRLPIAHVGFLSDTLPDQLPERISFAHVDLGPGGSSEDFSRSLQHGLTCIYPRLAPGAVCLLMDYCDPDVYDRPGYHFPHTIATTENWNQYPQVKRVCDEFFRDKPESVWALYSGAFSHGFFRKGRGVARSVNCEVKS